MVRRPDVKGKLWTVSGHFLVRLTETRGSAEAIPPISINQLSKRPNSAKASGGSGCDEAKSRGCWDVRGGNGFEGAKDVNILELGNRHCGIDRQLDRARYIEKNIPDIPTSGAAETWKSSEAFPSPAFAERALGSAQELDVMEDANLKNGRFGMYGLQDGKEDPVQPCTKRSRRVFTGTRVGCRLFC